MIDSLFIRTSWAGGSAARAEKVIEDYASTAGERINTVMGYSGNQPGDPMKAAKVIMQAIETARPPLRLPLGQQAIDANKNKIAMVNKDLEEWEEVSMGTAF